MLAENGLQVDVDAINEILGRADVLVVGFTLLTERLLVDCRTSPSDSPLVTLVEPVNTVQERYAWLGRHRGSFGAPEGFSFFTWPHTVKSLRERRILEPLRTRLAALDEEAAATLEVTLEAVESMERDAMAAAVRGTAPWRSIWSSAADGE